MSKKTSKKLEQQIAVELNFLKNVFSVLSLPTQKGDEDDADYEMVSDTPQKSDEKELPKRARNIAELEEKLQKLKSQNNFNLKNKLVKKSLTSKLNKKIKKRERKEKLNKTKVKPMEIADIEKKLMPKVNLNNAKVKPKPVFNNDAKLVFSKFDFSSIEHNDKSHKAQKDPKKILEIMNQQEQKLRHLEENEGENKVKEIKEKAAWKNILQKAEGQKIKDDPILLKKSIKRMEQKKTQSKKQWDNRVKNVEQKKDDRQKKRRENISKMKKEKKSKIVKAAVKRGRVVI